MPPPVHVPPAEIDWNTVISGKEEIRRTLPQRFEMEQIDAICLMDSERLLVAGYKDVRPDEFWTRGHFPNHPLMPGVLMCEAAAQVGCFYCVKNGLVPTGVLGFGGLEDVRFRGPVHPGDRLLLIGKGVKLHRRQKIFDVQGFVDATMVFHGKIIGVPLSLD